MAIFKVSDSTPAALGFRVKSGWATAVLLTGSAGSPQLAGRRAIDLCDRAIPESRQPYHAAMGKLQTDETRIARLRKAISRATAQSVTELLEEYRNAGNRLGAACLVIGSDIDPERITNPHIRAHALEGRLFRTVLEDALRSCGLSCSVMIERTAYAQGAQKLQQTENDVKNLVAKLGRSLGGPWRADEKMACLAAWVALNAR
jgi:hypothetical protein